MKQAVVYLRGIKAGILTEDENGYTFEYDVAYLASADAEAVSLTLPLSNKKVCQNAHLHYFTYKAPTFTSWGFVIT